MEMTITAAAIATIISAITSALISLLIRRSNKYDSIENQLDSILKIAIEYPYLESEEFTSTWKSDFDTSDEKYLRYDVYGTLLFNYLTRIASYYNYNRKKIEDYIAIKDWIRLHGKYWKNPKSSYENVDSYDKKFVELVESYLK